MTGLAALDDKAVLQHVREELPHVLVFHVQEYDKHEFLPTSIQFAYRRCNTLKKWMNQVHRSFVRR